jgi:hypothetical protein
MSDLELLFLALAVIYGLECACWVRRGSVVFLTWLGRQWRVAHPGTLLGNQRGGVIFAHPLPPLGTLLAANQFPLSLSPDAVLAYVALSINPGGRPIQTEELFRFDDIRTVQVSGKKVLVNGEVLLQAPSPAFAEHLAQHLRELSKLAPAKREGAIEEIFRRLFDTEALEKRWHEFQKAAARLPLLANFLFVYLFVFAPLLIWYFGLKRCWPGLALGLIAFTLSSAILFRRAHKVLCPAAEEERFSHFLIVLLSPATTIRARDALSRPLLEAFHPLAVAKVFCSDQQFREFAGKALREIRYPGLPVCPRAEPLAQEAERYSRALLQKTVERFLSQSGLDPEALAEPPAPADETCRSYCPRCLAQFTTSEGVCADCGGLALAPFSVPAGARETAVSK